MLKLWPRVKDVTRPSIGLGEGPDKVWNAWEMRTGTYEGRADVVGDVCQEWRVSCCWPIPWNADGEGHSCWSAMDLEENVAEEVVAASALKHIMGWKLCAKTGVEKEKSRDVVGKKETAEVVVEENVRTEMPVGLTAAEMLRTSLLGWSWPHSAPLMQKLSTLKEVSPTPPSETFQPKKNLLLYFSFPTN